MDSMAAARRGKPCSEATPQHQGQQQRQRCVRCPPRQLGTLAVALAILTVFSCSFANAEDWRVSEKNNHNILFLLANQTPTYDFKVRAGWATPSSLQGRRHYLHICAEK